MDTSEAGGIVRDNNIGRKGRRRESFLDLLRAAATCAVVLLHTITGVTDTTDMGAYPLENTVFLAAMDLITWCVPVFILISGYLFLAPARKFTFRQMTGSYCRRIVLALILFGTPYACLELIAKERAFRPGMLAESVAMVLKGQSWSHMWYLYMILFLYLITPALKAVLARCPKEIPYFAAAVLAAGCSILPFVKRLFGLEQMWTLPDDGIYLFYYLCGYLFAAHKREDTEDIPCGKDSAEGGEGLTVVPETAEGGERERRNTRGKKGERAAAAAAALVLAGMVCSRLIGNYGVRMAYNYPFTVIVALCFFYLCSRKEEKWHRHESLLKNMGELCFAVYLVHPVFLNLSYKFLHITPLAFPVWISLPVFFAADLALSAAAAKVLRKIPGMARYVL